MQISSAYLEFRVSGFVSVNENGGVQICILGAALAPGDEPMGWRFTTPRQRGGTLAPQEFTHNGSAALAPGEEPSSQLKHCLKLSCSLSRGEEPFAAISGLFRFSCRPCA